MEFEITQAFPTLIARTRVPDAEAMNRQLQAVILAVEAEYQSLGRSNIGGWHSRPDFLSRGEPAVSALTSVLSSGLRCVIDASTGAHTFHGTLSVSGWATVCRAGTHHAPHSHPDSAWSGVYYVNPRNDSRDQPLSGVLEFLDPRAAAEAVTSAGSGLARHVSPLALPLGTPLHGRQTAHRCFF
jgi:uncharacterized protein (TIGR02466 family)